MDEISYQDMTLMQLLLMKESERMKFLSFRQITRKVWDESL